MSLTTGTAVTRYGWDPIHMPSSVIERVNRLGKDQPELLLFTYRKGRLFGKAEPTGLDGAEQPVQDKDLENNVGLDDEGAEDEEDLAEEIEIADQVQSKVADGDQVVADAENAASVPYKEVAPGGEIPGVHRSTRIKFQPKKPYVPSMTGSKYAAATALLMIQDHGSLHPDLHRQLCQVEMQDQPNVVAVIMTQLSLKMGLKTWKDKGRPAAKSEMKQLHMCDTFITKHYKDLDVVQRKSILESHMFLKEKKNGDIKGRTVAGGNKKRDFISKEDSRLPTVSTEAVLLSCIIDAEEERDVTVIDIPNEFIQTRVENEKDMVYIRVRGVHSDTVRSEERRVSL